jgi:hypothetical protein
MAHRASNRPGLRIFYWLTAEHRLERRAQAVLCRAFRFRRDAGRIRRADEERRVVLNLRRRLRDRGSRP